MLNLFQHPICKVYTRQSAHPLGCRNKFGMTIWGMKQSIHSSFHHTTVINPKNFCNSLYGCSLFQADWF